jgi:chitinase
MNNKHNTPTGKRAIYYFCNWSCYARNYQVKDIPEDVMDIAYAFYNLDSSGNVLTGDSWADTEKRYIGVDSVHPPDSWNDNNTNSFYGNFGQLKKVINSGRPLNIQLSIGGWTWSKSFSDAISNQGSRSNFVASVIALFKKFPIFNGVSLDWEYLSNDGVNYGNAGNTVRKEDPTNFELFLKELREKLDNNGMRHYTIAFCCTAAPEKVKWNVKTLAPYIDEFHLMTYDFHDGNWGEKIACHHTNPRKSSYGKWSCEEAADYYIAQGVPSQKIFIGGAFYSRGFANTTGLGKPANGGSPDKSWENGIVDYKDLPISGAIEYIDPESKAAYSYDPVRKVLNSYDNKESIIEKCRIIFEKNLGGIIIWENSGDKRNYKDPRNLTRVLKENLTHGKPQLASLNSPSPPPPTNVPSTLVPTPPTNVPSTVVPTPPTNVPPTVVPTPSLNVPPTVVPPTVVPTPPTNVPPTIVITPPTNVPSTVVPTPPTNVPPTVVTPPPTNVPPSIHSDCLCKKFKGVKLMFDISLQDGKVYTTNVEYKR